MMRYVIVLATMMLLQGGEARAQDLEQQVFRVQDGVVAFRYQTNDDVLVCERDLGIVAVNKIASRLIIELVVSRKSLQLVDIVAPTVHSPGVSS